MSRWIRINCKPCTSLLTGREYQHTAGPFTLTLFERTKEAGGGFLGTITVTKPPTAIVFMKSYTELANGKNNLIQHLTMMCFSTILDISSCPRLRSQLEALM